MRLFILKTPLARRTRNYFRGGQIRKGSTPSTDSIINPIFLLTHLIYGHYHSYGLGTRKNFSRRKRAARASNDVTRCADANVSFVKVVFEMVAKPGRLWNDSEATPNSLRGKAPWCCDVFLSP
jgi:hypothetical protein